MKTFLLFSLTAPAWAACTLTVTSPASAQSISGTSFTLSVGLTTCPALASISYLIDAQAGLLSLLPPYSYNWNTYLYFNGPHEIIATGYDGSGALIATSAAVDFTIANTQPNNSGVTITPGTPLTSNWSGKASITSSLSGSTSPTEHWWIDGIDVTNKPLGGNPTLDTTRFDNGSHIIGYSAYDGSTGWTNSGGCSNGPNGLVNGALAQWSRRVTFANGATAMESRNNAREIFLASGNTFTLASRQINTDESITAISPVFYSENAAIATVGQSTGVITAVANGATKVDAMNPQNSITDGTYSSLTGLGQAGNEYSFGSSDIGKLVEVTAGSGCTAGFYFIIGWQTASGVGVAEMNANPCPNGTSSIHYIFGQTRSTWVFVNPLNLMPHFGSDGSMLTAYDPVKSLFVHSFFESNNCFIDYGYAACVSDYAASGMNTVETAIMQNEMSSYTSGQSAFQGAQTAYVASQISQISPYPSLHFHLIGDNLVRQGGDLWATTRGAPASYTTPAAEFIMQSWTPGTSGGNAPLGLTVQDEVQSSWDHRPNLGSAYTFGSNGLSQIICTTSPNTCQIYSTDYSTNGAHAIIIEGASHTAMNSAPGSVYSVTAVDSDHYTIPNPGIGAITLNASNDSGLTIEPYGSQWYNSNTDYIRWNAFPQIRSWFTAVSGYVPHTYANAAGTSYESMQNWGNFTVSNPVADYNDIYFTTAGSSYYLAETPNINSLISIVGDTTRAWYGAFNPNAPILIKGEATPQNIGFQGNSVAITSISSAGVVTFSASHAVAPLYPGISRLSISGSAALNGNFYFGQIYSSTTALIAYAASTFVATGTGGTVTFQDGSTFALSSINASGTNANHGTGNPLALLNGDVITFSACTATIKSKRGQTFTISGNSNSNFNSNTFLFVAENLPTCGIEIYRQVPAVASTGGTANVIPDMYYQKGRNWDLTYTSTPAFQLAVSMETLHARAAGVRQYQLANPAHDYDPKNGFLGASAGPWTTVFGDKCVEAQMTDWPNPHGDWSYDPQISNTTGSAQGFNALGTFAKIVNRIEAYYLQPPLNSPDYGSLFEASAHAGSYGDILIVSNMTDGPQIRTIDLSPYVSSGQNILRYTVEWNGIDTAVLTGTTSDSITFDPESTVIYLFPVNFGAEYSQPSISARLADISGATSLVVKYNYSPYLLNQRTKVANCSSFPCSLPVDRKIGPIYYQMQFLNSSNQVLATTDVQTM